MSPSAFKSRQDPSHKAISNLNISVEPTTHTQSEHNNKLTKNTPSSALHLHTEQKDPATCLPKAPNLSCLTT